MEGRDTNLVFGSAWLSYFSSSPESHPCKIIQKSILKPRPSLSERISPTRDLIYFNRYIASAYSPDMSSMLQLTKDSAPGPRPLRPYSYEANRLVQNSPDVSTRYRLSNLVCNHIHLVDLQYIYPFYCHSVVDRIVSEAICEAVSYSAALTQRIVPYRKKSPLTSAVVFRRTAGNLSCFGLKN